MIITALRNWTPAAGDLVEWHPTAAARAAAEQAPIDPVPPTFLQSTHVRGFLSNAERGRPHRAFLGVTSEFDGALDTAALTRALTRFVARHDGVRTYCRVEDNTVVRRRIDSAAVEFEVQPVGALDSNDSFEQYAIDRFAEQATPTSWPGFALGAVTRDDDFTLYYGCDHAFTDGVSQVLALTEIAELYAAELSGREVGTPFASATDGFAAYADHEHRLAESFSADAPEIVEWLDVFADNGGVMPKFPLDLGLAPGRTAPVRPVEFDLLDADGAAAFDSVCKASGGKLISGLYAAVAITDYEVAGRADYYGMSVLNTRDRGNFLLTQGWMCNFAPVAFSTVGSTSFTELVPYAHSGHLRAKRLAAAPVQSVLTALLSTGVAYDDVTASPNMLSYIDFRWFPGVGTLPYERAMVSTGEGETANASIWFNRDRRHLYLGSQTPDTEIAREQLERYHAHLKHVICAVARDGEYRIEPPAHHEPGVYAVARHDN